MSIIIPDIMKFKDIAVKKLLDMKDCPYAGRLEENGKMIMVPFTMSKLEINLNVYEEQRRHTGL